MHFKSQSVAKDKDLKGALRFKLSHHGVEIDNVKRQYSRHFVSLNDRLIAASLSKMLKTCSGTTSTLSDGSSIPIPTSTTSTNIYISKLPVSVDETMLSRLFSEYGQIECCRVQRSSQNSSGRTFGFVKFRTCHEAQRAIDGMNGARVNDSPIDVKFADQDPADKVTGGTPSDNLYVRNLPNTWTQEEIIALFRQFGSVVSCRLLHVGEGIRGAGALVRMNSIQESRQAMEGLNGRIPQGGSEMLIVRYADTPEEKARRKAKRNPVSFRFKPYETSPPQSRVLNLRPEPIIAHQVYAVDPVGTPVGHYPASWTTESPTSPFSVTLPQSRFPTVFTAPAQVSIQTPSTQPCSIYIKNLPPMTDKLFLYEKFAPFGGISSVKPMVDELTGACKGFGFVNYTDSNSARMAVEAMNNAVIAGKVLHVSLQTAKITI